MGIDRELNSCYFTTMELIATCAFGLEKLVHDELKKLGLWTLKTEDGRVTFKGDETAMIKANLWLHCADRIQIKMTEFPATTFDELFDHVNAVEWEKYIGVNDLFPVDATSVKSALHSEPAIQSIVKKAIVKRLQQKYSLETLPENSNAVHHVMVKVNKDQFVVAIDSSGNSLHKRGYRTKANLAPIKETLAAAMITLSDWTPQRTLVDPFCGSGTILIEAAMMANNVAPGFSGTKRDFAFEQWGWLDQTKVIDAYKQADEALKPVEKLSLQGFDIDPLSIEIAQENAKQAGFEDLNFQCADFKTLDFSQFENCTFITNPPYGERLEDREKVLEMYREFGEKFAQTKNCSLFIITSNENFPTLFGRPADKNRKLFNGKIRCYLFSFFAK